ncbi:hypothetical protein [Paraburkholderia sp. JHI869]|uniref:hypothetical protein n=1 Tax=Paraburkholderia sp. JHI869 TaxID=3112959 RepID=UPI003178B043
MNQRDRDATANGESTSCQQSGAGAKQGAQMSERLNSACFCVSLDHSALRQALASELGLPELVALVEERCPYLFSMQPVFISDNQADRMEKVVSAIEVVVALPAWRERVLADAPAVARHDPGGAKGVFFGYDFHLRNGSVGLIEVNTNAGGAMLNAVTARAHHACCLDEERLAAATDSAAALEKNIVDMFLNEWQLSNRHRPLKTIAIVDTDPQQQYLYPEFLLFQRLFQRYGLHAVIADPSRLELEDGVLMHNGTPIDLVYNRLTDFMLEEPASAVLRRAYLDNAVVLTPHPQAHALYADKRNLAVLCDTNQLQKMAVPQRVQDVLLSSIPHTEVVIAAHAERLWRERRRLFFKPTAGFGSRAAFRGDKLTKRVWQDILAGDYVAQAIMAPGERGTGTQSNPGSLKFDMRVYTYQGDVQWKAARMYQGQTTNFRTPGGGFAPVYTLPDVQVETLMASGAGSGCCDKTCL